MLHKLLASIFFCLMLSNCHQIVEPSKDQVRQADDLDWKEFNQDIFVTAKTENKLVLLNIGANWCHWCHVMDDSTYSNPDVQSLLKNNFVLSHEDQDSRADLFSKYRNYGWPATIVFNTNGEELLKLRGYQNPKKFISLLENTISNPTVIGNTNQSGIYTADDTQIIDVTDLIATFNSQVDFEKGSFKTYKKLLNKPAINFAIQFSAENDSLKKWLTTSIINSYQLLDPVWGGIYQYSTHYNWTNAHYEKILRIQAEYMDSYALYGLTAHDNLAIVNAEKIYNYCDRFLSSNYPLFDNSQDADYIKGVESTNYYKLNDTERRALGIPAVNKKQFLKENALMSKALANLWIATDNLTYLLRAQQIVNELRKNYCGAYGLYKRSPKDKDIYSLEDNLALLEVLILANQIGGQEYYLEDATKLVNAILKNFTTENYILKSNFGELIVDSPILPSTNYEAVLLFNQLGKILNDENFILASQNIYTHIYKNEFSNSEYYIPHLLMAQRQLETEQYHAVWVSDIFGTKTEFDFVEKILALSQYKIVIERVDLNNLSAENEILYGSATPNTLFMCTTTFCSSPIRTIEELEKFWNLK